MLQPGEAFKAELEYQDQLIEDPYHQKLMEEDRLAAIEEAQARIAANAKSKADKIIKKNSRELERLNKHAQKSVLDNNFEAYKYAIEKSRKILRQPFNDELIRVQWETTRRQIWEILNGYKAG